MSHLIVKKIVKKVLIKNSLIGESNRLLNVLIKIQVRFKGMLNFIILVKSLILP